MKKIEVIMAGYGIKKVHHIGSTGERDAITSKGNTLVELLVYIEKYINENGFTIKSITTEPSLNYFLLEKTE